MATFYDGDPFFEKEPIELTPDQAKYIIQLSMARLDGITDPDEREAVRADVKLEIEGLEEESPEVYRKAMDLLFEDSGGL